jgi:hypothetical protein
MSHMLENGIRTIKFGRKFLTMVILEGILLYKVAFKETLDPLLQIDVQIDLDMLVASCDFGP